MPSECGGKVSPRWLYSLKALLTYVNREGKEGEKCGMLILMEAYCSLILSIFMARAIPRVLTKALP